MSSTEMIEKYYQTRSINGHTESFVTLRKATATLDLKEREKFQKALCLFDGVEHEAEAWLITLFLVGDLQYTQYIDRDNIYDPDNLPSKEDIVRFARGVDRFLSNNNRTAAFSRAAIAGVLARGAQRPVYDVFQDFYRVMVADSSVRFTSLKFVTSEFKAEIIRRMIRNSGLNGTSVIHYHIDGFWDSMFSSVEDFASYLNDYTSHPNYQRFMTTIKYLTAYKETKKTNQYQDHESYSILKKYSLNTPEITLLFDHIMGGPIQSDIKNIFNISETVTPAELCVNMTYRSRKMSTAYFRAKTLFNSVYHVFRKKFGVTETSTQEELLFMIAAAYHFSFYILPREKKMNTTGNGLLLLTAAYIDDLPAVYRLPAEVRDTLIMGLLKSS